MIDKHGNCPKCNSSWDGGEIPENIREHYSPPFKWSRVMGLYSQERDITVAYKCPDCGEEFEI